MLHHAEGFSAFRRNQASKIVSRARARFEFVIVNVMDEDGGGNREDCRMGLSFAFAMQHLPLSDFGCAGLRGNLGGGRPRQVKRLVQSYAPRGGVVRKGGSNIPISAFGRKPFVAGRRCAANGAAEESREEPGAALPLRRISAPIPAPHRTTVVYAPPSTILISSSLRPHNSYASCSLCLSVASI